MADDETTPTEGEASPSDEKRDPMGDLFSAISKKEDDNVIEDLLRQHIQKLAIDYGVGGYKLLFLIDEDDSVANWHANRIYAGANDKSESDILLVVHTNGGRIEPAYLISKTCARLAKSRFIVAVPRRAKSAGTLIALGANEVHMGFMSELGPIDPQIGGFPALGMQNALSLLADLTCKYPDASDMIGGYLSEKLDLRLLGYFERISESAIQYAERLLHGKELPKEQTPAKLAHHFVNHYKDHGFVIDGDEATQLLGEKVVCLNTKEYDFANALHESLDFINFLLNVNLKKQVDLVGGISNAVYLRDQKS